MAIESPPPFRIETDRLVIRAWRVEDAPLLAEALHESREHLLPWLPWAADEPLPVAHKEELLKTFRRNFLADEDYIYGVLDREETRVLGGTGLHPRVGPRAFEIGYWVRVGETGRGLATETAAALTRAAFERCGVDRIEIRVEPENLASLVIPKRLGFEEEALLKRRVIGLEGPLRDVVVFSLFADTFPGSPAKDAMIRCFDRKGRPIGPDEDGSTGRPGCGPV